MEHLVSVQRDEFGRINGISLETDGLSGELLPNDAPEVTEFLQDLMGHQVELTESDLGFVRVLDDLIEVLVRKDVIKFTDLPEAAQDKVLKRQSLRSGLGLLGDSSDETI